MIYRDMRSYYGLVYLFPLDLDQDTSTVDSRLGRDSRLVSDIGVHVVRKLYYICVYRCWLIYKLPL